MPALVLTRTGQAVDTDTDTDVVDTPHADAPPAAAAQRRLALSGGLWSAASQVLPAVGTAVLSVAAGRYLGSGPLGQQSLIAYVNSALSTVVVVSLNTALLQVGGRLQGAGSTRRVRALMRWAIGAHLLAGALVFAIMTITGRAAGEYREAWLILGAVSVLDAAADGLAVRLILTEGWAPIGRLRLVFQLIGPPLGLVFLFAGYGIAGLFVGDGIAALGLLVAAAARYRKVAARDDGPQPQRSFAPPVPIVRAFALFALGSVITQVVTKRVEFVIMAMFSTDVAIGQYSVAFMSVSLISMIPLGIAGAAMPLVANAAGRGQLERAEHHLRLALRMGTALMIPVCALLAALGPEAVILVYGTSYESAARLTALAAVSLLVAVICGVCTQFWSGQGKLGIVLGTGAIAGVADIGTAFALIPHYGALGAVLANIAGQAVLAVGLVVATVRRTGAIGWRFDGLLRMTVAAGAGATAAALVRIGVDAWHPVGPEPRALLTIVLGGVVGVAVVVLVARRLTLFDRHEQAWLVPLMPGRLKGAVGTFTTAAHD